MLGGGNWSRSPPTGKRATRGDSCVGSSGRCSTARQRSGCARPRTCRRRSPRGWRSPPCRRVRTPPTSGSGLPPPLTTSPRGRGWGQPACAVAPSSWRRGRPAGGRAARQCRHPAAEAGGGRPRRDRARGRRAAAPGARGRGGLRDPRRDDDPMRRPGGAGPANPGRRRGGRRRRRRRRRGDRAARADRRARRRRRVGCDLRLADRVHATVDGERVAIEAYVGLPDGSESIRDRVEGIRPSPRSPERCSPSACSAPAPARSSPAPRPRSDPGSVPNRTRGGTRRSRLSGRRRAGGPGADDGPLAGADRRRRRDLPRPPDPARRP